MGVNAGQTGQSENSIAIGNNAGRYSQGQYSIAIGPNAGSFTQGTNAIAIGTTAGLTNQGVESIAIGNSAGSLTTNTTYYYRVVPYGGANQSAGYASDEFQYTTGANERNISLSIGGHKIGAMYYRVYRSTTFNNFTNAYYFETPHINFTDYGHTTLQTTPKGNKVITLHSFFSVALVVVVVV
jgi:hypothetical protein